MERTDALQKAELAAEAAQQRHDAAVIDGDQHNDGHRVEDGERGGRDAEAARQVAVHGCALLHEEAAHLQGPSSVNELGATHDDYHRHVLVKPYQVCVNSF